MSERRWIRDRQRASVSPVSPSRRVLLRASASLGGLVLAGCAGGEDTAGTGLVAEPVRTTDTIEPAQPAPDKSPSTSTSTPTSTSTSTSTSAATDSSSQPPPPEPAAPPPYDPPYPLPSAGQALAISTNTASSAGSAEFRDDWNETLFNSYGGGAYLSDFSAGGAYVIAGTGGHGHGCNTGAILFDFADATWKQRKALNPNQTIKRTDYAEAETTGAPYWEILGSNQTPSPPHPYSNLCPVPKEWVGNTRGGVVYVTRAAVCNEARTTGASHWFDLDSQLWARRTDDTFPGIGSGFSGVEGDSIIDPKRRRYYVLSGEAHYASSLRYLDASDWRIRSSPSFSPLPSAGASGRMFMHRGDFLIRNGVTSGSRLYGIDLNNIAGGWKELRVSGTPPATDGDSSGNRWAHWRGRYYHLTRNGGSRLSRLIPPADPMNGTWIADSVTINVTLPARGGTQAHYTALFEVAAIDCLAWIPGWGNPVYVIRPE